MGCYWLVVLDAGYYLGDEGMDGWIMMQVRYICTSME